MEYIHAGKINYERPKNRTKFRKIIKKFINKVSAEYKKLKAKLKYICAFEIGTHGHHIFT